MGGPPQCPPGSSKGRNGSVRPARLQTLSRASVHNLGSVQEQGQPLEVKVMAVWPRVSRGILEVQMSDGVEGLAFRMRGRDTPGCPPE